MPRDLPPHLDGPTVHATIGEIEEPAEASTARDPEGSVPAHTHRRESSLAEADTTSTGMPYLPIAEDIDKFQIKRAWDQSNGGFESLRNVEIQHAYYEPKHDARYEVPERADPSERI